MKTAAYTGPGYLPRNDREVVCLKALWVCLLRWDSSLPGVSCGRVTVLASLHVLRLGWDHSREGSL